MAFGDKGTETSRVPPRPTSTSHSVGPTTPPSTSDRESPRARFDFEMPSAKGTPTGLSAATWRKCVNGALGGTLSILMFQSGHPFLGLVAGGVAAVYGFFVGRDFLNEFAKK